MPVEEGLLAIHREPTLVRSALGGMFKTSIKSLETG